MCSHWNLITVQPADPDREPPTDAKPLPLPLALSSLSFLPVNPPLPSFPDLVRSTGAVQKILTLTTNTLKIYELRKTVQNLLKTSQREAKETISNLESTQSSLELSLMWCFWAERCSNPNPNWLWRYENISFCHLFPFFHINKHEI